MSRLGAIALLSLLSGCALAHRPVIGQHRLRHIQSLHLNSLSVGDAIERGRPAEALVYLRDFDSRAADDPRRLEDFGRAKVALGDFADGVTDLLRATTAYGRASGRGSRAAWEASRAAFFAGDLARALQAAQLAQSVGIGVPDGWIEYLRQLEARGVSLSRVDGERTEIPFRFSRPRLPRIEVGIGGQRQDAVVDTGASLSFVTESAAARLGILPMTATEAEGSGLHGSRFPARFSLIPTVEIGGIVVRDVPVAVVPDWALEFEGNEAVLRFEVLLGCHFWKAFHVTLDYPSHRLRLQRPATPIRVPPREANLFYYEGKPVLRVSINGIGWFRFLLDTGSEFSLIHRAGYDRYRLDAPGLPVAPVTVHGIGKSQAQWKRVPRVALGSGAYQVAFEDILLTSQREIADDGIVGSSFLEGFIVDIDFPRGRVELSRPEAPEPLGVRDGEGPLPDLPMPGR